MIRFHRHGLAIFNFSFWVCTARAFVLDIVFQFVHMIWDLRRMVPRYFSDLEDDI